MNVSGSTVFTLKIARAPILCKIGRAKSAKENISIFFLFFFFLAVLFISSAIRQNGRNKITEKTTRSSRNDCDRNGDEKKKKPFTETLPFA